MIGCFVVKAGCGCLVGGCGCFVGGLEGRLGDKELALVLSCFVVGNVSDLVVVVMGMGVIGFDDGLVWGLVAEDCGLKVVSVLGIRIVVNLPRLVVDSPRLVVNLPRLVVDLPRLVDAADVGLTDVDVM